MGTKKLPDADQDDSAGSLHPVSGAGTPIRLSKPQRELLAAIEEAPDPDRYDIIAAADRATVESLIRKKLIEVRKIPKSRIPGGKISREEAKRAILAVSKSQADQGSPSQD